MGDPEAAQHIPQKRARTAADSESFFGSEAYRMLDADCAGALSSSQHSTVLLWLGGDGAGLEPGEPDCGGGGPQCQDNR
jgi:hypothetical protein